MVRITIELNKLGRQERGLKTVSRGCNWVCHMLWETYHPQTESHPSKAIPSKSCEQKNASSMDCSILAHVVSLPPYVTSEEGNNDRICVLGLSGGTFRETSTTQQ